MRVRTIPQVYKRREPRPPRWISCSIEQGNSKPYPNTSFR